MFEEDMTATEDLTRDMLAEDAKEEYMKIQIDNFYKLRTLAGLLKELKVAEFEGLGIKLKFV